MEEKFKVSIIVAIYNVEKYITKCINSLIAQDYKNIEIILVDDCSSDNSGSICDEFKNKDDRIIVVHHETNKRHSMVRNSGLEVATGDYIMFVDGDDWVALDFVSYLLGLIIRDNSDMAISTNNFTTRDLVQIKADKIELWTAEKTTAELLFPTITVGCWNKIYKRDFIEKHNIRFRIDLFTAEGDRFINDVAQRINHACIGRRKVYYYRLNNPNSATAKYDIRQSLGALYAFEIIKEEMILDDANVNKAWLRHFWLNHVWNIRQILTLSLTQEYSKEYRDSIRFVRKYGFQIAMLEKGGAGKIKTLVTGLFPVWSSKYRNKKFDERLKSDISSFEETNS